MSIKNTFNAIKIILKVRKWNQSQNMVQHEPYTMLENESAASEIPPGRMEKET